MAYKINPITGKHDYYQLPVVTPSEVVNFDQLTPTSPGVIFEPNTPTTADVLYVSSVDASTWIYSGTSYITYAPVTVPSTPFYLLGTTVDAGGNKTAAIQHLGPLRATTFTGNGLNITGINAANLATGVVSVNRLGLSGTRDNTTFLRGDNTWATLTLGGKIGIPNQTTGVFTYYTTLELASAGAVSGDTIYVYPGTYTITTTATNGIAKSGVNYVFAPGCIINKSSAGDMFNDNGFALPCNVFGYGSTFSKTGSSGVIYRQYIANAIFEATTVTNTISHCFVTYRGEVHFKVDYATSTAGVVLGMAQSNGYATNRVRVDMVTWRSTAGNVIGGFSWWYYTDLVVNGSVMESTAANAVDSVEAANCVFNVVKILGTNYGITANDFGGQIAINCVYCTGFQGNGQVRLNGHCQKVYFSAYSSIISFVGGTSANITVTGGTVTTALQCYYTAENAFITISGGTLNVNVGTCQYGWSLASTGGVTNIHGALVPAQLSYGVDRLINGGTVNVYSNFTHGGNLDSGKVYFLKLQSGILRLKSNMRNNMDFVGAHGIVWSGGTLIVDGVSMYITNTEAYPIQALTAGLNLKVLSGGMSTNKISGLLTSKKHRWKYTIIAVANTTLYLNDTTGGDEAFVEVNTGIYNTKALLAQRMVTLINASATLDLTASQDTPGTDDYFYVEADIAGVQIARGSTLGNLTALEIRQGSYAMTNITGGTIIEDADVE